MPSCRTKLEVAPGSPLELAFVSDTQEPIWLEKLWLKTDNNRHVTRRLFESIARTRPLALFHGGDLVASGSSASDWRGFWEAFAPVNAAGTPFFATPGNHEYLFWSGRGKRHFQEQFAANGCTFQSIGIGNVTVLLVNSNFSKMSEQEAADQDRWLLAELAALEADPHMEAGILITHYSPFTNSTIVSPSQEVKNRIVPPFLKSGKMRLFLSGHAHTFERFTESGKQFLVIGGGGGLLQSLRAGGRGFFHYLHVKMSQGQLSTIVRKYDSKSDDFSETL
ncbi:MAG: hypothetical protein A2X94_12645 [Bdellovibrionales bacterium GWB1_55_8]|nr:MAG: hypothetical protein A2X94_12645 [Bdellovibrionales bacterium GWB1_55_8]